MELTQYFYILRRWLWLLLLALFLGAAVGYLSTRGQPNLYRTSATISIGTYINVPNPTAGEIQTGMNLTQTYNVLAKSYRVLSGTVQALKLNVSPDFLGRGVNPRIVDGTSLMRIEVTWDDPEEAAAIANGLVDQLILNSPTNLTDEQQRQIDQSNEQIHALDTQLKELRVRLDNVDAQLATEQDYATTTQLGLQRDTLIDQINSTSATIAQFTSTIANMQQRANSITVVEPARVIRGTITEGPSRSMILGAAIALTLAIAFILVREFLDRSVKTSLDVVTATGLPVLGVISRFGKRRDRFPKRLVTQLSPFDPAAEGYRRVRTNLISADGRQEKRVYLVTSAEAGEGKTVTSANLAIMAARAGQHVLLVDADLRRPRLHEMFEVDNRAGLTTMLEMPNTSNGSRAGLDSSNNLVEKWRNGLKTTSVPGLKLLTSGPLDVDAGDLLAFPTFRQQIDIALKSGQFDFILIDTPPCLAVADSTLIALSTDATPLLVVRAGRTRRETILKCKEEFERIGKPLGGIILNQAVLPVEYSTYGFHGVETRWYKRLLPSRRSKPRMTSANGKSGKSLRSKPDPIRHPQ